MFFTWCLLYLIRCFTSLHADTLHQGRTMRLSPGLISRNTYIQVIEVLTSVIPCLYICAHGFPSSQLLAQLLLQLLGVSNFEMLALFTIPDINLNTNPVLFFAPSHNYTSDIAWVIQHWLSALGFLGTWRRGDNVRHFSAWKIWDEEALQKLQSIHTMQNFTQTSMEMFSMNAVVTASNYNNILQVLLLNLSYL